MDLAVITNRIQEEFPDNHFIMVEDSKSSSRYNLIHTVMDEKISFKNIVDGPGFENLSDDDIISYLIETVTIQKEIYKKIDRAHVIKDRKTVMYLDSADPVSLHKLTDDEFDIKVKEYEITKDELRKKAAPNEDKVYNSGEE